MPTVQQVLAERVQAETRQVQQSDKVKEMQKRAEEHEDFERCERLLNSRDFQWFMVEVNRRVTAEHDGALDRMKTPVDRNDHVQRHDIAKGLADFIPKRHAAHLIRMEDEKKAGQEAA